MSLLRKSCAEPPSISPEPSFPLPLILYFLPKRAASSNCSKGEGGTYDASHAILENRCRRRLLLHFFCFSLLPPPSPLPTRRRKRFSGKFHFLPYFFLYLQTLRAHAGVRRTLSLCFLFTAPPSYITISPSGQAKEWGGGFFFLP